MRNTGKIAVLCAAVFLLSAASGCKKKFDPNDFDGGAGATAASASAAASTTAPAIDSSAATTADATDAGDGLAPLQTGKGQGHVAAATGGGGGGATKPKADPPECVQARKFCNELPAAERAKAANQKACSDNRFACFNKGGHL